MTDYTRLDVSLIVSTLAGLTPMKHRTQGMSQTLTPAQSESGRRSVPLAGEVIETGAWTTVTCAVLWSTGFTSAGAAHTAFMLATFRSAGNAGVDNKIRIPSGGFLVIQDLTVANDILLAADTTADQLVEFMLIGT